MVQSASGGKDPRDGEADYSDIKQRLDRLGGELNQVKGRKPGESAPVDDGTRGRAMGFAMRMTTELVAGVFVGGFIGYFLDKWLGTAPFLLIVFLLFGVAAALFNSVRAAQRMQKEL
jgi:ATP synthase protein I